MVIPEDRRLLSRKHISPSRPGGKKFKIEMIRFMARYRRTKSELYCAMKSNVTIERLQAPQNRLAW